MAEDIRHEDCYGSLRLIYREVWRVEARLECTGEMLVHYAREYRYPSAAMRNYLQKRDDIIVRIFKFTN